MYSGAIAGQNAISKAPRRLASTMTIVEAPGKMHIAALGDTKPPDNAETELAIPVRIGFRRFQLKRPTTK